MSRFKIPIFIGGAAARPNQNFDRIMVQKGAVTSSYNALVLGFNKRLSHGIQFLAHYTFARAEDLNQGSVTFTSAFPTAFNQFDLADEKGRSNFDVKNRFVGSFIWELPFGLHDSNPFVKNVLAGWKLNGIVVLQDGGRVTSNVSGSLPTTIPAAFRDPDGTLILGISGSPNGSGGSFRVPFEDRNAYKRKALENIDLRLAKEFKFKERYRINFIAEAFNLFNRTNSFGTVTNKFALGQLAITTGTNPTALPAFRPLTDFLQINSAQSTFYRERQMQLALRFSF